MDSKTRLVVFGIIGGFVILLIFSLLSYFGAREQESIVPFEYDDPLVNLRAEGGLCEYGTCWANQTVQRNGVVLVNVGDGTNDVRRLSNEDLNELSNLIKGTDFRAVKSKRFFGVCPSAYDGFEYIYTFFLGEKIEIISSCEFEIDYNLPLFKKINELINQ
ncbi:hypothetical protein C4553_00890 [Candidatus Parcubacteria bacterium]|nr:MAG: hypothetical protein C4553_00890 [Candidatus Parcubacteria bacterium]